MSERQYETDDERDTETPPGLGDVRAERERNKTIKQLEIVEKGSAQAVVRNIMGTPHGRKWMADLLAFCDLGTTTFSPDLTEMAHREGRRAVGYRLLNEVCDACSERYAEMRAELKGESRVRK